LEGNASRGKWWRRWRRRRSGSRSSSDDDDDDNGMVFWSHCSIVGPIRQTEN
jgi:hypothetical protein